MSASTDGAAVRALVVTWNNRDLLPAALDSLLAQRPRTPLEVVVVDNASTDGTAALLAARYPQVTVVRPPRNLGFAGGVALGAAGFSGQYLVLLNDDARFQPDAVAALVGCAEAPGNERVGAVTAAILLDSGDDPPLVNSTGTVVSAWGAASDRDWRAARGTESTDPDVFGFCGGAALLRMNAFREVGGIDADLFLYYEDVDLSWRMRAAGWTIRYEASAVAWHHHASSSGVLSPTFRYYNTRNSLVVAGRHAPAGVAMGSAVRQVLGLFRVILRGGRLDPGVRARARGIRDAARRLPAVARERRAIWRTARVSRRAVWRAARR